MRATAKVSVSLPAHILERADRERRETGESRSEFFRRALEALFASQRREVAERRYLEGYVREPESEYEVASAAALAAAAFEPEDWS